MERPDKAVIVKSLVDGRCVVFASWGGGYLTSDEWKRSSPITKFDVSDRIVTATTFSGNQYVFSLDNLGLTNFTSGILTAMLSYDGADDEYKVLVTEDEVLDLIKSFEG